MIRAYFNVYDGERLIESYTQELDNIEKAKDLVRDADAHPFLSLTLVKVKEISVDILLKV